MSDSEVREELLQAMKASVERLCGQRVQERLRAHRGLLAESLPARRICGFAPFECSSGCRIFRRWREGWVGRLQEAQLAVLLTGDWTERGWRPRGRRVDKLKMNLNRKLMGPLVPLSSLNSRVAGSA